MTHQEARRIVEATTRFDARYGYVWLREVRWLRAVDRQRREDGAPIPSQTVIGAAPASASRGTAAAPEPDERRPVLAT